ncbi:MAG: histidine phosphatase family protein [Clostridia bacterium]|nr:histidine phosphatase family protein [Clostridia bacterium]
MLILMRHGEDDPARLGGWSDAALTEQGRRQAEEAAERLAAERPGIRRIFASDLPRARETAEIVGERLGLPVTPDPAFREINNGEMAGMPKEEAREKYPGIWFSALGFDERYPGGESPHEFEERIRAAWATFKERTTPLDGDTLLVTHWGVINVILCAENGVEYTNKAKPYPTDHAQWQIVP